MTLDAMPAYAGFSRLQINRIGLWLFLLSESFLFAALISARYYLLGLYRPSELNQQLGLAISIVLLASSLTAYLAERSAAEGQQQGLLRYLLATVVLGLLFLVGVAIEWAEAFLYFPPRTAFGTVFLTLTGFHAAHVMSGILILVLVFFRGRAGAFSPQGYWGVEGSIKYWHFVDVVWLVIYPTLYLVS